MKNNYINFYEEGSEEMLNLENYKVWIDKMEILKYPKDILEEYNLPKNIINILAEIGLPKKAQPFLWFLKISEGALKRLDKFYDLESEEESNESKGDYLQKFIVLGKTGGNAVCLNEKFQVVYVNYTDFTECFVNETLEQLLEFILSFDNMVNMIQGRYRKNIDYLDYITNEDICILKKSLVSIANDSLEKYDFWNESIEFLEEQIEYQ
ncbi:SUKH-4 family immunity protein [Clostridium sp. M14]|uniref:SUKH-4 family immunity protein n=1 Tax=Clostridium sp. M14 TaxID=2716311 RepID=UPI0013EEDB3A|nr:SUKH-4 family immunity protein [Clostridium sp. M14]MBZ9691440.1 SUKH-4 family immunity protein [Clostridium sp. M14]